MVKIKIGFYSTLVTCCNMVGLKQQSSQQAFHIIKP